MLMLPVRTLKSWGSSSRLVLLSILPAKVTLGSSFRMGATSYSFGLGFHGPELVQGKGLSVPPILLCLKIGDPFPVSRRTTQMKAMRGKRRTIRAEETAMSVVLFTKEWKPPLSEGPISTTGIRLMLLRSAIPVAISKRSVTSMKTVSWLSTEFTSFQHFRSAH